MRDQVPVAPALSMLMFPAAVNDSNFWLLQKEEMKLLNEVFKLSATMHSAADGKATLFDDRNSNLRHGVSNSETSSQGVNVLHFDATKTPRPLAMSLAVVKLGMTQWSTWVLMCTKLFFILRHRKSTRSLK